MSWFKLKFCRFGVGRDKGPPPSFRMGWIQLLWWPRDCLDLIHALEASLRRSRNANQCAKDALEEDGR
ncbi:hypothetical protein Geu3261_0025_004 [Komagataeibacter europaeus NBRC 3261]|uniref:Uncharacterized protein n=1 Tax=Komagataeibacter europaeus NBRC 3261 TaxID=1234669 RepID=A0A0D6PWN7_KOMEU|nr:hypothetical protein [Komagataeibacter europaeus]GAN95448.1 hypothetical protein Geu3261_0025_004 [Komagataeibacter europaeus NBRC 3261]